MMLEKILQEVKRLDYPSGEIGCDLEAEEVTDQYMAAAYGFGEAKDRILEIIRRYGNAEWIPCSRKLPENEQEVEVTYTWKHPDGRQFYGTARAMHTDGTMTTNDSAYNWEDTDDWEYCAEKDDVYIPEGWWECVTFGETFSAVDHEVIAWKPRPEPYRPEQKGIDDDYKQQIMNRFLRTE